MYDAVLASLNERLSISVSSNEFAITSTIDILYLRYHFFRRCVCCFHWFSDCLVILAVGIVLALLFLWLFLELSRIELQIVAVYMVALVHVYN